MHDSNAPIVVFDSGVGGLTVLHEAMSLLPRENYIYYADMAHVPYGTKKSEEIRSLLMNAAEHIALHKPKALVIACNTATSAAIETIRKAYDFPVIGMEPAVKPALSQYDPRKVLVLATERTLKEKKYNALINALDAKEKVECKAMGPLVEYAEEFDFDSNELMRYLQGSLGRIDWDAYHTLVLGCTHFIYFRKVIRSVIPDHITIIDGNEGTVKRLKSLIITNNLNTNYDLKVELSGEQVATEVVMPYLKVLQNSLFHI